MEVNVCQFMSTIAKNVMSSLKCLYVRQFKKMPLLAPSVGAKRHKRTYRCLVLAVQVEAVSQVQLLALRVPSEGLDRQEAVSLPMKERGEREIS